MTNRAVQVQGAERGVLEHRQADFQIAFFDLVASGKWQRVEKAERTLNPVGRCGRSAYAGKVVLRRRNRIHCLKCALLAVLETCRNRDRPRNLEIIAKIATDIGTVHLLTQSQ